MKLLVFSILFLFNLKLMAQEPSSFELTIEDGSPVVADEFEIYENERSIASDNSADVKFDSTSLLTLNWSLDQGTLYFGKAKSQLEFNSIGLNYSSVNPDSLNFWTLEFDYYANQSNSKIIYLSGGYGKKINLNESMFLNASLMMGYGSYIETSSFQNISYEGFQVLARADLFYKVSDDYLLNLNLKWNHQMFTNGIKYWATDPVKEMVLEFNSIGLGITKEW